MARRGKIGIDYFSHDVDILQDKKIKIIKAKFGLLGYAVYLRLLEELYRENGYYLHIDEDFNILFSDDSNIDYNEYILILNECINKKLFSSAMYEKYSILTSARIQTNYCLATERRREVEFIEEYLLIDVTEKYNVGKVNVCINCLNVNINSQNVDIGTQSKVKESKVKESKEYKPEKATRTRSEIPYQVVIDLFNDLCPSLPRVIKLNTARKKYIKQRWDQNGKSVDFFKSYFKKVELSNFLTARNSEDKDPFVASFDWLMKGETNLSKVIEGNYDNRSAAVKKTNNKFLIPNGNLGKLENNDIEKMMMEKSRKGKLQAEVDHHEN